MLDQSNERKPLTFTRLTTTVSSTNRRFTVPAVSHRLEELSQSRKAHADVRKPRSTPEWSVAVSAMRATASPRLKELAQPRPYPAGWKFHRAPYSVVTKAALSALPSERITVLAKPRVRTDANTVHTK
uniref:Sperm microtubule associated protein 2-like n=1 Tax=Pogona vitticeps TaxID=103695 RepID=A0ABM5FWQ0_9SAUR